jgi:hypothetical protein
LAASVSVTILMNDPSYDSIYRCVL